MTTFDCMSRGLHRKPCFHGGEAHFAEPQFSLVGKDKVWEGCTPTTQRNAPCSLIMTIMFSRSTSPANQLQTGSSLWKSKRLGHTTRTPFTHHQCRVASSWKSKIKIVGMSYSIWLSFHIDSIWSAFPTRTFKRSFDVALQVVTHLAIAIRHILTWERLRSRNKGTVPELVGRKR